MTANNTSGWHCRSRAHAGRSQEIYDALPREVRDRIKIAKTKVCCGCIRNRLRRVGLETLLAEMDRSRRIEREKRGREIWYVPRPEIRP